MSKKVTVSVVGCSLADYVYSPVDFHCEAFQRCTSKRAGDGGLVPGQLVFLSALEKFTGRDGEKVLAEIVAGRQPAARNVGGPAIVAGINAAQLLGDQIAVNFYGARGNDEPGDFIMSVVSQTPVNCDHYAVSKGTTPYTKVLSDPTCHNGKGERTFVNNLGSAANYGPEALDAAFFAGDVHFYSATALVPVIHDHLTTLMKKSKDAGKITMLSTVFDFRNEALYPNGRWPLGESVETYRYIDLLAVDWDEARRLSGEEDLDSIIGFFTAHGVSAIVITHGAKDTVFFSDGRLFKKQPLIALPICHAVDEELAAHPEKRGDTTGCGDNFAGGLLASLSMQLGNGVKPGELDLIDAAAWAAASGGFACFTFGGTYLEKHPGEKLAKMQVFHDAYLEQLKQEKRLG